MSIASDILKAPFRAFKRHVWKVGPMASNPYATHIPILVALAHVIKPRRVVELGSGFFSTPLFLNREIFREVVQVSSLENDAEWFRELEQVKDPRLERILINGPMNEAVKTFDFSPFDLIFVDDSKHARYRKKTLAELKRKIESQILVVHDIDQWRIRLGVYPFAHHYELVGITPQSAVAWHTRSLSRESLREIDRIVTEYQHQIPLDQPLKWNALFSQPGLLA